MFIFQIVGFFLSYYSKITFVIRIPYMNAFSYLKNVKEGKFFILSLPKSNKFWVKSKQIN